ncbi:MAG TPA: hypothetical protein VMX79_07780 [bacterium]|nr:hypothetical protein [bacterium]
MFFGPLLFLPLAFSEKWAPAVFGEEAYARFVNAGGLTIVGVVTINDQPYLNLTLEVDDGSRAPYVVSFDAVIPRAAVPQFQPGALVRLKVDPNDPQQVVIDWSASRLVT